MSILWCAYLTLLAAGSSGVRHDPARLGVELLTGAPLNIRMPMEIRQNGEPTVELDATFRSEPFEPPIYWVARIGLEGRRGGFALELMHDKLYLENRPPEIDAFAMSHGLNILTLQRVWTFTFGRVRAGLGAVIAHAENTVRGRRLDQRRGLLDAGYTLAGPGALLGADHRVSLVHGSALVVETRVSLAPLIVPIVGGDARLTHLAAHVLFGLSVFPR